MRRTTIGLVFAAGAMFFVGCNPSAPPATDGARASAAPAPADGGLYCTEHGVPEAYCTLCHEELKASLLLCKEHGDIPEEICTLCHPEVEKEHNIEMCPKGHRLPKHFCSECAKGPAA